MIKSDKILSRFWQEKVRNSDRSQFVWGPCRLSFFYCTFSSTSNTGYQTKLASEILLTGCYIYNSLTSQNGNVPSLKLAAIFLSLLTNCHHQYFSYAYLCSKLARQVFQLRSQPRMRSRRTFHKMHSAQETKSPPIHGPVRSATHR